MTRQDKIELAAYRLMALLFPHGWIGTEQLHLNNATRTKFVALSAEVQKALTEPESDANNR